MYNLSRKSLRIVSKLLNATKKKSATQKQSLNAKLRAKLENVFIKKIRNKFEKRSKINFSGKESYVFGSFDDMMFTELLLDSFEVEFSFLRQSIRKFKRQRKNKDLMLDAYERKKKLIAKFVNCESAQKRDQLKEELVS